jgi:predicted thioesterase
MADAQLSFTVTEADTAEALGSGDLPVLATPRLLAWCEAATCAAASGQVDATSTTVGISVSLEHLAATGVGGVVLVGAQLIGGEGRRLRFVVTAHDGVLDDVPRGGDAGRLVGRGEVVRAVVDRDRFLAGIPR